MILVVLAHFAVGVIAERTICEPLHDPEDNKIFSLIDQVIPLEKILQVQVLDANHRRGRHRRMQPAHTSISSVIV